MKKLVLSLVAGLLMVSGLITQPAWADPTTICGDPNVSQALKEQAGCFTEQTADKMASGIIKTVLSLVGVLAVGVMIFGGIMYIISTGDAAKVHRAKNIIIYGLVGLVISLLSYAIVGFVLDNVH